MAEALDLAEQGLGRVWPNPSVGCVLVRDGVIIGRGATQPGGRPHAEVVALEAAGDARGATAYVSLEPCAHYGRTPPCADALVRAGIERCVVALLDPDPRVDGKGISRLQEAGIATEIGLGEARARAQNEGFFLRVREGRPLVTGVKTPQEAPNQDAWLELDAGGTGVWAEVRGTGVAPVRWWLGAPPPVGVRPWRRFDCPVGPEGPAVAAVLGQLGAHGLTRVAVGKNSALFQTLQRNGLVDRLEA